MAGERSFKFRFKVDGDAKGAVETGEGLEKVADKADKASRKLGEYGRAALKVAAETKIARAALRDLTAEYSRTGDTSLLKGIRQQASKVKGLENLGKTLKAEAEKAGEQAGKAMSSNMWQSMGASLQGLPSEVKGGLMAVGTAAAAISMPLIGAEISSAVVGSVGVGGILGGIMLAAKDARVRAAASMMASRVGDELRDAASPFVDATLSGIGKLSSSFDRIMPSMSRIFSRLAPYVDKLSAGLGGALERMMPGIERAVDAARPMLEVLARELPRLGDAVGKAFTSMGREGKGATEALVMTLRGLEGIITFVGRAVAGLTHNFMILVDLESHLPGFLGNTARTIKAEAEAADKAADATGDAGASLLTLGTDATIAAGQVSNFNQKINDEITRALGYDTAIVNARLAVDDFKTSVGNAANAMSGQGQKADELRSKLYDTIGSLDAARQQEITTTGNVAGANKTFNDQVTALLEIARKAGMSKSELEKLAKKYQIDVYYTTHYQVRGTPPGEATRPTRGVMTYGAKGGVIHAADGAIVGSPTVLFGERETGHEAYIPQKGISEARAMDLIGTAASWYGAGVVPRAALAGGYARTAPVVHVTVANHGVIGSRMELEDWLTGALASLRRQGRI